MKWEKLKLGDCCTVTSSKRFHLSERSNSGVPFYCSKEIILENKGEEIIECDYISESFYNEVTEKYGVPQENDLLVTTRGTIGIPYLYQKSDRFYFADGNFTWLKDFKKTLAPEFLYYWFLSHEGQANLNIHFFIIMFEIKKKVNVSRMGRLVSAPIRYLLPSGW